MSYNWRFQRNDTRYYHNYEHQSNGVWSMPRHMENIQPQPQLPMQSPGRGVNQRPFYSSNQSDYSSGYRRCEGNTSSFRNQNNLSYVRIQNNSASNTTQRHSQVTKLQEDPQIIELQEPQQLKNITEVSMIRLPFLEVIASSLGVRLHLTKPYWTKQFKLAIPEDMLEHIEDKTNNSYQILVRFCKYAEIQQKDYFPSDLQLKVNGQMCPLPGCSTIPKGPAAPIEITSKCDFRRVDAVIDVRSREELVMFVQVTRKLTHEDLLQKLLAKSPIPPTVTKAKIKEKLQEDQTNGGDITMTSLHFALLCPLSKARIKLPCRASTCDHVQCFDAACYLKMNEIKPKWVCPVCAAPIEYENLHLDELFKKILDDNISSDKILLQADGSWKPLLQDFSESILTLDDTFDPSTSATNIAAHVTPDSAHEAQQTTIDLLSEDEASVFEDENGCQELGVSNLVPNTENKNDSAIEVVVLSEEESFGSPTHTALQHQLIRSHWKSLEYHQPTTSTPNTNFSHNTRKRVRSKTRRTRARTRRRTPEDGSRTSLNSSTGRSPARMVLRSHTRIMKLREKNKTVSSQGLNC